MCTVRKRVKRTRKEAIKYLNKIAKNNTASFRDEIFSYIPQVQYTLQRGSNKTNARVVYLNPFKIKSEQDTLYLPVLKKKIRGKFKGHWPALPEVVKEGNQYILIDGNHRLASALLLGNTRIRVMLYDDTIST